MRIDREKVIKGLEICSAGEWNSTGERDHTDCPYYPAGYTGCTCKLLMRDALTLLKAQDKDAEIIRKCRDGKVLKHVGNGVVVLNFEWWRKMITNCGHIKAAPSVEDLLKAQEPRVMTAEDMWTLKFNDTVIIEQKIPSLLIPAIVRDNIKHDHALEVLQVVTASTDGTANADYEYYGNTWRCWTSRPTDAQREATPWN